MNSNVQKHGVYDSDVQSTPVQIIAWFFTSLKCKNYEKVCTGEAVFDKHLPPVLLLKTFISVICDI